MNPVSRYAGHPSPSPGDFYVENACCTLCGVPQMVAPDLIGIGKAEEGWEHCYWKKQPETHAEMQQAFAIFGGQELGCHRYAGSDESIIKRIGRENCDISASHETYFTKRAQNLVPPWTGAPAEFDLAKYTTDGLLRRLWKKLSRQS